MILHDHYVVLRCALIIVDYFLVFVFHFSKNNLVSCKICWHCIYMILCGDGMVEPDLNPPKKWKTGNLRGRHFVGVIIFLLQSF